MPSNYALGAAPDAEVISDARGNKILSWASGPIPFLLRVPVGTKLYALTPAQYAALSQQPEGVQSGEVEQWAWNDEAAWALAASAEAAGAERDSDDDGTWWTLRIEHFNALSQQPEAQGVVDEAMAQRFLKALPELYAHDAPPVSAVMLGLTAALTGERNVC